MERRKKFLKGLGVLATRVVQIVTLVWILAHFCLTFLYAFPMNPMKIAMEPLLQATIGRFFSQNWSLFAPNPLTDNRSLLVRCLEANEVEDALHGKSPAEGWYDLTTPLIRQHQEHRFSAYDRVARPQENAIRAYLSAGNGPTESWGKACQQGSKEACKEFERAVTRGRLAAAALLVEVASSFCAEAAPGATAASLRVRTSHAVPWSRRNEGEPPKTEDYALGTYPLIKGVVPGVAEPVMLKAGGV